MAAELNVVATARDRTGFWRIVVGWVLVIAAVAVLFDHWFGAPDRALSAAFEAVPHVGFVDSFDRPDSETLSASGSSAFAVTQGAFGVSNGAAVPLGEGPATAVISLPGDEVAGVSARIRNAVPGAGLVFRYRAPDSYWLITPSADRDDWVMYRVVNGQQQQVSELSRLPKVADIRLDVTFAGSKIFVRSAGRLMSAVDDSYLEGVPTVGIHSIAGAKDLAFDDVILSFPAPTSEDS